jgi:hypothetical protein
MSEREYKKAENQDKGAGEFKDEIDELTFSAARVLKLDRRNSFYVKYIVASHSI